MPIIFESFPKIPRYSRDCIITEKIDGTNAQVLIVDKTEGGYSGPFVWEDDFIGIAAGSRNKWLTVESDNHAFAKWVAENGEELLKLGYGRHFGEWWGRGIQRGYGINEKRFSLFNVTKWNPVYFEMFKVRAWERSNKKELCPVYKEPPKCCHVVPPIASGEFGIVNTHGHTIVDVGLNVLRACGSLAAPGYMKPEGIVIFHVAGNILFKKTIEEDNGKENG